MQENLYTTDSHIKSENTNIHTPSESCTFLDYKTLVKLTKIKFI